MIDLSKPLRFGEFQLLIHPRERSSIFAYYFGKFDGLERSIIRHFLRPGCTAVDIGASIGVYTVLLARLVGPTGTVYAFEPDPSSFTLLERNVQLNRCQNVICRQSAIGDMQTESSLIGTAGNPGDTHLSNEPDYHGESLVRVLTLDEQIGRFSQVDFMKIDVQGMEPSVLRGARALLSRSPKCVMLCEFEPASLRRNGEDPLRFLSGQVEQGYALYRVLSESRPLVRVQPSDFSEYCRHVTRVSHSENLLLVPDGMSLPTDHST